MAQAASEGIKRVRRAALGALCALTCGLASQAVAAAPGCDVLDAVAARCQSAASHLADAVQLVGGTPGGVATAVAALESDVTTALAALGGATAPADLVAQRARLVNQLGGVANRAQRAAAPGTSAAAARKVLGRADSSLAGVRGLLEGAAQLDHCRGAGPFLGGSLAGRAVLPADNWWNQDVSAAPVARSSAALINFIGANIGLHPDFGTDFGIPYVVVAGRQAKIPIAFGYDRESDHGAPGMPPGYPIPPEAKTVGGYVEGGVPGGGSGGDRHLLLVDRDHWMLFEMYGVRWFNSAWQSGSGAIFDLTRNDRRTEGWTSADAAGLAILPGLVRADEVFEQAQIRHALRFTVRGTKGYVYPASHDATSGPGGDLRPPMGLCVRLKPSVDVASFAPPVRVILRAMQRYGMIVADNGRDWYVSGAPDPRWDDELMHDEFARVTGNDFEVVTPGL